MWMMMDPQVVAMMQADAVHDHMADALGVRIRRECKRCDVSWVGDVSQRECWVCGEEPA